MRCSQKVVLYDPAALGSRTPKADAVKAEIQCTLEEGHESDCGARVSNSEPEAVITWRSTRPTK